MIGELVGVQEWTATLLDGSVGAVIGVVGAFWAARYAMKHERRDAAANRLREAIGAARRTASSPIPRTPEEAFDWLSALEVDLRVLALEWAQQGQRLDEAWATNAQQALTWAYIEDARALKDRLTSDPASLSRPHGWERLNSVSRALVEALELAQTQPPDEKGWVYSSIGSMNRASGHFPSAGGRSGADDPPPS